MDHDDDRRQQIRNEYIRDLFWCTNDQIYQIYKEAAQCYPTVFFNPPLGGIGPWIIPPSDERSSDWDQHITAPLWGYPNQENLRVIHILPNTNVYHGTQVMSIRSDDVLLRGNFFGTKTYSTTYAQNIDRTTEGRLFEYRWKHPDRPVPLVPIDECVSHYEITRQLQKMTNENAEVAMRRIISQLKYIGYPIEITEDSDDVQLVVAKFSEWFVRVWQCRSFSAVLSKKHDPFIGGRTEAAVDNVLFPWLGWLLGVTGFIARQRGDDGSEFYLCNPSEWLRSVSVKTIPPTETKKTSGVDLHNNKWTGNVNTFHVPIPANQLHRDSSSDSEFDYNT